MLYYDGKSLFNEPYEYRWKLLKEICGNNIRIVERILLQNIEDANRFLKQALSSGAEGVMVKHLKGIYSPGVRGKLWLKIKPVISLDSVIIAAEWGHGRRHRWLSNYHLGVWDETSNEYLCVGKTFKELCIKGCTNYQYP